MTDQTKKTPPRSRATPKKEPVKAAPTEHEDVLDPSEAATPKVEPKPKPKRVMAAKPVPKVEEPVKVDEPTPVVEKAPGGAPTEHQDVLEPLEPKAEILYDATDIAAEEAAMAGTEDNANLSANYSIDSLEDSYLAKDQEADVSDQYPMGLHTRNQHTLKSLVGGAYERQLNNQPQRNDDSIITFGEANSPTLYDPAMYNVYANAGSNWNNGMVVGDRIVRSTRIKFGSTTNKAGVDVSRLTSTILRRTGTGGPIMSRLFHSGLIVQLNPMSKADRVLLVAELNEAHLDVLRRTSGLIHGTNKYYANRIIINAYMANMSDANLERTEWDQLWSLIDHRDIQLMASDIQAASYQRGYRFIENCGAVVDRKDSEGKPLLNDDGTPARGVCGEMKKAIIDFTLLTQIDQTKFTEWQKKHMLTNIRDKVNAAEIRKYQSQGEIHGKDYIEAGDGIQLIIKAPTIARHVRVGEEWIEAAEEAVNRAIATTADDTVRNQYITQQLEATAVKDTLHWVTGISIDGEELYIDDTSTFTEDGEDPVNIALTTAFRHLSSNPALTNSVNTKIQQAIASRVGAVPGIPSYRCKCGTVSNNAVDNGTAIFTPLDMVARFFILTALNQ